jgi:hypothetical protein
VCFPIRDVSQGEILHQRDAACSQGARATILTRNDSEALLRAAMACIGSNAVSSSPRRYPKTIALPGLLTSSLINPGSSGPERIMSVDDLILAFYGIGTIFPVIIVCATFAERRLPLENGMPGSR